MQGKVEISGVNTSRLQVLKNDEMTQLLQRSGMLRIDRDCVLKVNFGIEQLAPFLADPTLDVHQLVRQRAKHDYRSVVHTGLCFGNLNRGV